MEYTNLGHSGLKVSRIGFGNMINHAEKTREEDTKIIKKCLDAGINFFDTAEIYAAGDAEIALGKIFKELKVERESVVVATKVWVSKDPEVNSTASLNRKHIKEAIAKSLQRLDLEYVDVLFAHGFDPDTPLEEIVRAFHEVVESGQSFYWATSNWNADDVFRAFAICEKYNLHKPICGQNQYNMLDRKNMEVEYQSLFEKYHYGLVAWSPLAGGYLTGKHLDGVKEEEGGRFSGDRAEFFKMFFFNAYRGEKMIAALKEIKRIAEEELKCSMAELAVAWVLKFQHLSTALIGARTLNQLESTLKALEVVPKLTPELEGRINKVLDNTPTPPTNFLKWKPHDPIRPLAKE